METGRPIFSLLPQTSQTSGAINLIVGGDGTLRIPSSGIQPAQTNYFTTQNVNQLASSVLQEGMPQLALILIPTGQVQPVQMMIGGINPGVSTMLQPASSYFCATNSTLPLLETLNTRSFNDLGINLQTQLPQHIRTVPQVSQMLPSAPMASQMESMSPSITGQNMTTSTDGPSSSIEMLGQDDKQLPTQQDEEDQMNPERFLKAAVSTQNDSSVVSPPILPTSLSSSFQVEKQMPILSAQVNDAQQPMVQILMPDGQIQQFSITSGEIKTDSYKVSVPQFVSSQDNTTPTWTAGTVTTPIVSVQSPLIPSLEVKIESKEDEIANDPESVLPQNSIVNAVCTTDYSMTACTVPTPIFSIPATPVSVSSASNSNEETQRGQLATSVEISGTASVVSASNYIANIVNAGTLQSPSNQVIQHVVFIPGVGLVPLISQATLNQLTNAQSLTNTTTASVTADHEIGNYVSNS